MSDRGLWPPPPLTVYKRLSWSRSTYLDILDWWDAFLWEQFDSRKWPGFFVLFEWAQQQLTCKLRLCNECENCRTFVCWSCMRRVSWDFGCDGDMPDACDDCWAEAHEGGRYGR